VFIEYLPDMDITRMMTKRLVNYIEVESLKRTHVSIAAEVGVDEKTVRNIFRDHIQYLEVQYEFETPEWMGMDEVKLMGRPRCIITNLKERTVVDLLKGRSKKTVISYLSRLQDREQVQYVCIDMWKPYRDAVRGVLPQAVIVIDKFHVVRMANAVLDTVRRDLREGLTPKQRRTLKRDRYILLRRGADLKPEDRLILEVWTDRFPDLGTAYRLKESFFEIYNVATNSEDAQLRYRDWKTQIPDELQPAFKEMLRTMHNWSSEIFAYFDAPSQITNGYTEAMNGVAKLTNHTGRGYSFDALRAKILYNGEFHVTKPILRRGPAVADRPSEVRMFQLYQPSSEKTELNYGPRISTVVSKIVHEDREAESTTESE